MTIPNQFHGIGGAFFPEHHPRDTWREYVEKIADAGLSFVRMAEFTWDKMEPREGEFDFSWLDEVMALLWEKRIQVIMCTPTAVPPVWACERYPEIHPVLDNGKLFGFGTRRYTCPTSPAYHHLCEGIASALAQHYGDHPQVMAWQLDNEFGHPFCFCPRCLKHFQVWCARRFGDIGRFNDALCTHFLGQTLQYFGQVQFPNTYTHPSMWQLYHQFNSDVNIDCLGLQAQVLRENGVQAPISTNMMITWHGYDHEKLAPVLDFICGDHYGLGDGRLFGPDFINEAFTHAYLRGLKPAVNLRFHEFQWGRGHSVPLPGEVRWEALVQVGLGADLINYFRLDTCPSGMERDGGGLLGVHGKPGRIYPEVRALSAELARLQPALDGSTPAQAPVAFLFTYANHCEFAHDAKLPDFAGPSGNGYGMHLARHFQAVARQNIACDIIYPGADFSAYRVIVAPGLYILSQELADKLRDYVAGGGTLILTSLSGVADENARVWDIPVPGPLAEVCGIEILDYGATYSKAGPVALAPATDTFPFTPVTDLHWIDEIHPTADDVDVLARFDNPFYRDAAALTRHPYGAGQVYYLGAVLAQDGYNEIYHALAADLKLQPVLRLPDGLYSTVREKDGQRIIFINNPGTEERQISLPDEFTDLLTGETVSGEVVVPGFGVLVLVGHLSQP